MKKAIIALFVFSLWSCKPQQLMNLQGYIIGESNDIKPMTDASAESIPENVLKASVLISTAVQDNQVKFCSGTLVQAAEGETNFRILTNHHCFANVDDDGKIDANWIPVACVKTKVYFGFSISASQDDLIISGCKEGSLRSDVDGDVAIFTLKENPPAEYQPLEIVDKTETGTVNAYIVHYPDVASNYKSVPGSDVRLPAASVTTKDCKTRGLFDVREWHLDTSLPYSFKHTCDLVKGSSGSALINAASHKILGVNWGGIKVNYESGTQINNVATGADFVQAFLAGNEESLKSEARDKSNSADAEGVSAEVERNKKEKGSFVDKMKVAACGQIGVSNTWSTLYLLLLLFGPFLLICRLSRKS